MEALGHPEVDDSHLFIVYVWTDKQLPLGDFISLRLNVPIYTNDGHFCRTVNHKRTCLLLLQILTLFGG